MAGRGSGFRLVVAPDLVPPTLTPRAFSTNRGMEAPEEDGREGGRDQGGTVHAEPKAELDRRSGGPGVRGEVEPEQAIVRAPQMVAG